jgi:uncharacterized protein DUF1905
MTKPAAKSFRATLERLESGVNWVIIRVPRDVPKVWGTKGRLKVKGEINDSVASNAFGLGGRPGLTPNATTGH